MAAGQHHQRPFVSHCQIGIHGLLDRAVGLADLHHRVGFDEQAGQLDGFFQGAAPIVAQVENDPGDVFLLQLVQELDHVRGGAFRLRLVLRAGGVKRGIEGRQVNHAQPEVSAPGVRPFDDLGFGRGFSQRDFIPDHAHDVARGGIRSLGNDGEAHFGALGPANKLHGFGQAHVHDVHGRLVALRNGDNPVIDLDEFALDRRPARQQPANLAVAVIGLQFSADAKQA